MRIITKAPPRTSFELLRTQLNLPTLENRRKYFFLLHYYKLKHNNYSNTYKWNLHTSTPLQLLITLQEQSIHSSMQ